MLQRSFWLCGLFLFTCGMCLAQGKNEPSANQKARLEKAIAAFLKSAGAPKETVARQAFFDLNGDKSLDALVLFQGSYFCGSGGCTLAVFVSERAGFRLVSQSTLVDTPVRASAKATKGWRDLIVHNSGGGAKPAERILAFDGKKYAGNASTQRKATASELKSARVVLPNP